MYENFTERALQTMRLASQEAQRHGHSHIGTEHILVALACGKGDIASKVLKEDGLDATVLREALLKVTPKKSDLGNPLSGVLPKNPATQRSLQYAEEHMLKLGDDHIDTEHLLLGILHQNSCNATIILGTLGISPNRLIGNLVFEIYTRSQSQNKTCKLQVKIFVTPITNRGQEDIDNATDKINEFLKDKDVLSLTTHFCTEPDRLYIVVRYKG